MTTTVTPAAPGKDVWNPLKVLQDDASVFCVEHNPAEEIVAGKIKRNNQGGIDGVNVLYPMPTSAGKARVNKAEIDNIGKLFHELWKKQPADRKPAAVGFRFGSEEYQAKRENCMAKDAFCFSGSKHKLGSRGLYAMMTREGYVVIVKTKSFTATQLAVEGGKGLVDSVRKSAVKYAKRQVRK